MPAPGLGIGAEPAPALPADTDANTDSSRTAPACPSGHNASADDSLIGRRTSKCESHVGQRYS
jgi:hypothetical protein